MLSLFRGIHDVWDWWADHFRWTELALPALIAVLFGLWIYRFDGWIQVSALLDDKRGVIYGTLASLLGSLLGFVIAAVAIVIGETSRLSFIKDAGQLGNLLRVFQMAIFALGAGTIAALVGLIADSEASPMRWIVVVMVFATLLAGFRVARAVWVLNAIVRHVGKG